MGRIYSRIVSSGSYLPKRILSNAELEKMVDTSDQWIQERTGICQRHIADDHQTTADLAEPAARMAMEMAGVTADDIDCIVVATTTPDRAFPSTACTLQRRLQVHGGGAAFDIQAACTGFVYALGVVDSLIQSGSNQCALVVGAEILSRIVDWNDRSTCVLFGDGAGAVVLKASEAPGIYSSHLHADGRYEDLLNVSPSRGETPAVIKMKGNEVFRVAVRTLGRIVDETLSKNNLQKSDIDWLIPHQANSRIIAATAKKLGISMDHVIQTVNQHGNTSAASVPLALDYAIRENKIKTGDIIMLEAFGGGFTWGSTLVKF